jgi:hypothetical protein
MKICEVITPPVAPPQKQEPLILTSQQQAAAVARAKKLKLKNLIAQRQAQDRNAAATAVTKQDIETAFVLNANGMLG